MKRYLACRVRAPNAAVLRRSGIHSRAGSQCIPDNSEPWLAVPPRTLAEVFSISDQIQNMADEWTKDLNDSDLNRKVDKGGKGRKKSFEQKEAKGAKKNRSIEPRMDTNRHEWGSTSFHGQSLGYQVQTVPAQPNTAEERVS